MDHIVCLDSKSNELDDLVKGNKSMILRGDSGRKMPYGLVKPGDVLYFINSDVEGEIIARGVVNYVLNSDKLSVEESFEIIIRHQDRLQLPDRQFEIWAGMKYLVFIGLDGVKKTEPLYFDKSSFIDMDDWIPAGKIEDVQQISVEKP